MFRTVLFFSYFFGYLFFSLLSLRNVKKLDSSLSVDERDKLVHQVPKKWAKTLVQISGSNVKVIGEENIPLGPVVFISNHEGNFDIPVLLGYIQKPFGFISKLEVKKIPGVAQWMEAMSCIFIDRKDRRQSIKAIREGIETLKKGHSLVIFPEGTRSKGGPVAPFKNGSFRLAIDAKVPIVPITIIGTSRAMETNHNFIKPAEIKIVISKPIHYDEYSNKDPKELVNEVYEEIVQARELNQ
jgi:1-acyl-sn-glycerol-3-phosphate acyltransferase